jgi:tetratricopeptide (TPR) repeat protein
MSRKSQIAIKYCYRFKQDHPQSSVLWVHASTVPRIDQAYKEIAAKARLPSWDDPKRNKFALVAEWLSQDETGEWLMVLDNADNHDVFFNTKHDLLSLEVEGRTIADYIPQCAQGRVLITSRDRRVGESLANRFRAISVPCLTVQEARDLFRSLVDQDDVGSETDVGELLDTLECLPLAITQAAAFITENSITSTEYLAALRAGDADIKELLSEELVDQRRDSETQNSVIRTWKLSFDHIQKSRPRAAEILSLMSVLDRQGISQGLLRRHDETSIEFTMAIGTLQAFSLITTEKGAGHFEVHRLVQLATQQWLILQSEIQRWREEALRVISEVYPVGAFKNWAICNSLTAHMQAVVEYAFDSERCQLYSATLLNSASLYDVTQGQYDVALDKCTKALTIRETLLGAEHPSTLTSKANLASTYRNQGRWKEAEELEVQVMETSSRVLGAEHPSTLTRIANLASTFWNQGRWKETEVLQVQVMETRKRVLGTEHPDTLTSIANLALTFWNQGRWKEAEVLQVQVMETSSRVLGTEHPDTLISRANLASTFWNQGRWKEAEVLQVQAIETSSRVLGAEHPSTLTSMANLASTFWNQGRWKEAEVLEVQIMETRKRVSGAEHPHTLTSIANLALTFSNQGRWKEAEVLQVQVMETSLRVLGAEHPHTLTSIANLALTFSNQGRWKEAEVLQLQIMETSSRVSGTEHPDTLTNIANLASTISKQGRWKEAEMLGVQVLEIRKRVLGTEHPDTLVSRANLASTFSIQGRWKEAEVLEVQVMETRKRVLGAEHPSTMTIMNNLAFTINKQGRQMEAIKLMAECVQLRDRVLGSKHPDALSSTAALAAWQSVE